MKRIKNRIPDYSYICKGVNPEIDPVKLQRFKNVLSQQAESYQTSRQYEIAKYIVGIAKEECPEADFKIYVDDAMNVAIIKGEAEIYPCVVAHLDQVHRVYNNYEIIQKGDILTAVANNRKEGDKGNRRVVGTGSDDLTGCWVCLESLIKFDNIKIALFQDEEIGCQGSSVFDLSFFDDVSFILQADRRHTTADFLTHTNGICTVTKEFAESVAPIIRKYGYSFNQGIYTDVGELIKLGAGVCGSNISCGYFDAHFPTEHSSIRLSFICLELFFDLIEQLGDTQFKRGVIKSSFRRDYELPYRHRPTKQRSLIGFSEFMESSYTEKTCSVMENEHLSDQMSGEDLCRSCGLGHIEEWNGHYFCNHCGYYKYNSN